MEDKKQIEEMAKIMEKIRTKDYYPAEPFSLDAPELEEKLATELYQQGYRKLPENAVVLSREEYEQLLKGIHTTNYTAMLYKVHTERIIELEKRLCNSYEQARKETAKKIITIIKDYYGDISVIAKITEQFGLEVK